MKRFFPLIVIFLALSGMVWAQDKNEKTRQALRDLIEKAEGGDAKSMFQLARLYETGYDTLPADSIKSMALYLLSAEKEYAPAMNFIGFRYYQGEGGEKNLDSAIYWISKAAQAGDITAAANLGYLYYDSPDFTHDVNEAEKWLTIAAEAGMLDPQMKLIEIKKKEWESLPPDSTFNLGLQYYGGKAPVLGTFLLELAAEENIPQAMALLGDAYSKGLGVPYDHQKSVDYFYQAASGGNPSAQFILAELLEFFPDTSFPMEETFETQKLSAQYWFNEAAKNGVADSETAYKLLFSYPEADVYDGNY